MILGITGGIGVGKSYVSRVFRELGIPCYNSDNKARTLMESDQDLVNAIRGLFGDEAYNESGQLNRGWIGKQVFANEALLDQLNSIVHPAVGKDFDAWILDQDSPYLIKEAAILIESGAYKQVDKLLVVTADEAVRIERVMQRDGVEKEAVLARMSKQMPQEEKLEHADFIIHNNPEDKLLPQVLRVHEALLEMAED